MGDIVTATETVQDVGHGQEIEQDVTQLSGSQADTPKKPRVYRDVKKMACRCNDRLVNIILTLSQERASSISSTMRMLMWLGYNQYIINEGDGIVTRSKSKANRKRILAEQAKRKEQEAQEIQRIIDATIITLD